MSRVAIGFDIGGTKIAAGLVAVDGTILERAVERVPAGDYRRALDAVARLGRGLLARTGKGWDDVSVGVAVAAFLDPQRRRVLHAANLDWQELELAAELEALTSRPVRLVNDADAAAWGEFRHGAGRDAADLLLVALGTGVGGGLVVDGQLFTGASGLAGEVGHLNVVADGRRCVCGGSGCLEQYASGTALVRAARQGAAQDPPAAARLLALAGGEPAKIDGGQVLLAAAAGDPVALAAVDEVGAWLGRGLAQIAAVLDLGVVVLAGGLGSAGEALIEPALASYREHAGIPALRGELELRLARLGELSGVVGAATLALESEPVEPQAKTFEPL